jgi:hypothetical protein
MNFTEVQKAVSACNFWIGLEYMNLVKVPDADEKRKVFKISSDADMPWISKTRTYSLRGSEKWYRAQIACCGLFNKRDYTAALRSMLQAKTMAPNEMRKMDESAVLLLGLDESGRICGEAFISSLPWFMGRLKAHLGKPNVSGPPDFHGFDSYQEALMRDVRELLVKLQLIPEEIAGELAQQAGKKDEEAAAFFRKGRVKGHADMKPLEVEHVRQLLQLIWDSAGWCPNWGPYVESRGQDHLVRIKLISMIPYVDRSIDFKTMNSMVANDVIKVCSKLSGTEGVGPALSQYLKLHPTPRRVDLRDENPGGGKGLFVSTLGIDKLPCGAWPDFPLVAAQQFAVNMSRQYLPNGGLYGVNGPPGTGKSTLLRDVIADLIVARAEVLAGYANPMNAFPRRGVIDGHKFGFWELDAALHGHGIVVASSNNGAVENVIKDLPKLTEPMKKAEAIYFAEVSDSIAAGPKEILRDVGATWGLVAALLGSGAKRRAFMSRFWFEAKPQSGEELDRYRLRSLKGLIETNEHGAVEWSKAVKAFNDARSRMGDRAEALKASIDLFREAGTLRHQIVTGTENLSALNAVLESKLKLEQGLTNDVSAARRRLDVCRAARHAQQQHTKAQAILEEAQYAASQLPTVADAKDALDTAKEVAESAARITGLVLAGKPDWLTRLFKWSANEKWRDQLHVATEKEVAANSNLHDAKRQAIEVKAAVTNLRDAMGGIETSSDVLEKVMVEVIALNINVPLNDQLEQDFVDTLAKIQDHHQQELKNVRAMRAEVVALTESSKKLGVRLVDCEARLDRVRQCLGVLQPEFYDTADLLHMHDQKLQLSVPYNDAKLRDLRVEVFRCAMQLNQSFVVGSWKALSSTLSAFVDYQNGKFTTAQAGDAAVHLWNAFFTVVPVVSSTFASFDKLFSGLGREELGTLLIDEAGQSTPQNALGAIWRSRRVMAVGDPLQLEPVVTQPTEAITAWRDWVGTDKKWVPPDCSTQVLADDMTPYGTELSVADIKDRKVWVGSPLRVHRRCLNPMFDAANEIAYANLMVHGVEDNTGDQDWLGQSHWFNVTGEGEGHWIQAQGEFTMGLIQKLLNTKELSGDLKNAKGEWHVNVISPYKDVGDEFSRMLRARFPDVHGINSMAGTVHTFQGKEADIVILLLGGNPNKEGAVSFFAGNEESPNLLNVALTRAKKRIYVVGDKWMWVENSGTFRRLAEILEANSIRKAAAAMSF